MQAHMNVDGLNFFMILVFIKQELEANMPSKTFEIQLRNEQLYEAETRPTIFEQTTVEPKKNGFCKKILGSFKSPRNHNEQPLQLT